MKVNSYSQCAFPFYKMGKYIHVCKGGFPIRIGHKKKRGGHPPR